MTPQERAINILVAIEKHWNNRQHMTVNKLLHLAVDQLQLLAKEDPHEVCMAVNIHYRFNRRIVLETRK